jgi:hypothetical protein
MTRPLFQKDPESVARNHERRIERLERRPLPAAANAGAPFGFPMSYVMMDPFCLTSPAGSSLGWSYVDNFGTNRWNPYYIEATADAKYLTRLVRLGPKGSIWMTQIITRKSSDACKFRMEIASLSENGPYGANGNGGAANGIGTLEDPDEIPATFLPISRSYGPLGTYEIDLYGAVTSDYQEIEQEFYFRLMGDDGAPLTTISANNQADQTHVELDGGAGMYAIRIKINGKNASSSGYRLRLHYWHLIRTAETLLTS